MLLLIAAVGLAWRIEYPLYETALAVTAGEDTISPEAPIRVMVLLAPETIVQCNDTVVLNTPPSARPLNAPTNACTSGLPTELSSAYRLA